MSAFSLAVPQGAESPAILYTANRDHLAWPAIEQLAMLRPAIAEHLAADIATWQPLPRAAVLYGSAARGDGHSDSDVDVFIIAEDTHLDIMQRRVDDLSIKVRAWTGNELQAVIFTPADVERLKATNDGTYANIRRDGIVLAGRLTQR